MGVVGIVLSAVWVRIMYSPLRHPRVSQSELAYLRAGGALVEMDAAAGRTEDHTPQLGYIKQLLSSRMLLGIYLANYRVNAITWFFLSWFPIYLVKGRGMSILEAGFVAALPAICSCWIAPRRASLVPLRRHSGPSRRLRHYRPVAARHTAANDHQNWPDPGRSFRKCS
ncbi:hypothetical protein D8L93_08475 [Sodalis-like symbiont of Bactericera trigonica]|nr:hypothetical protein D8L93_08475 [Sodalis-like symbiont of Bactericera trigonica]